MKKMFFLFIFLIVAPAIFGQHYFNPFSAIVRTDADVAKLSRQLACVLASKVPESCLLTGKVSTDLPGVYQKFVVFSHQGKRFSIYYQWQVDYDGSLLNENDFLSIYVRPEGSQGPDDLEYYKDYFLNGSWDEAGSGRYLYLAELEESNSFDRLIQHDYIIALKSALSYFN